MIVKTYKRNGKTYYLTLNDSIRAELEYLNHVQNITNRFLNITMKKYHGSKWNPEKFTWIVEG